MLFRRAMSGVLVHGAGTSYAVTLCFIYPFHILALEGQSPIEGNISNFSLSFWLAKVAQPAS